MDVTRGNINRNKKNKHMKQINILLVLLLAGIMSCTNKIEHDNKSHNNTKKVETNNTNTSVKISINTADNKQEYTLGNTINFIVKQEDTLQIDSVQFYINNKLLKTQKVLPSTINWNSANAKTGKNIFEARVYSQKINSRKRLSITLLSDVKPLNYTYRIINTFHHDRSAYTQGLVYENGFMYEATGLRSESTLRKVQLGTGDVIQTYSLPKEIFGEGIALVNDRIIQLTYTSYTGFVYDKESFNLLMKFNYPKAVEGWGLSYDGKNLIMSDGTYNLHFLDPESFSETGKLEVYDDKGPVNKLNELEIIDGILWANIYTTFKIVQIDIKTGKVLAYIDLSNILPQKDYEKDTDVLNGIAYDKTKKRIFVTGKKWPKLFEIQLVKN